MTKRLQSIALAALALALVASTGQCPAQDSSGSGQAQTPSSDPTANENDKSHPTSSTVLQGGVKGAAMRTEDGLMTIGQGADMLRETTTNIMKEATRKDTIVFRGPNYVGNGIVIPAVGGANGSGVLKMGEMPMRRKRLDKWVADAEATILSMESHMNALIIPHDKEQAVEQSWKDLRQCIQTSLDHVQKLKELSQNKSLINKEIGREALQIFDGMNEMDKYRNQVMKVLFSDSSQK